MRKKWLWAAASTIFILLIIVVGLYWKYFYLPAPIEIESGSKLAFNLSEGPSIAVLPFDNMSKDPDQEYFCDGITENIIAVLSHTLDLLTSNQKLTGIYFSLDDNKDTLLNRFLSISTGIPLNQVQRRQTTDKHRGMLRCGYNYLFKLAEEKRLTGL